MTGKGRGKERIKETGTRDRVKRTLAPRYNTTQLSSTVKLDPHHGHRAKVQHPRFNEDNWPAGESLGFRSSMYGAEQLEDAVIEVAYPGVEE
jgi:hypothetical protein